MSAKNFVNVKDIMYENNAYNFIFPYIFPAAALYSALIAQLTIQRVRIHIRTSASLPEALSSIRVRVLNYSPGVWAEAEHEEDGASDEQHEAQSRQAFKRDVAVGWCHFGVVSHTESTLMYSNQSNYVNSQRKQNVPLIAVCR